MSTVKITDLPVISHLNANTGNTIFVGVDLPSDTTGRVSATVLADGLYENKALKVGLPDIIFPNVIAQFAGSGDPYLQINAQNTDANNSIDYVATADIGTDANNYIDMGMNNSQFEDEEFSAHSALDGYLYVHGSVNSSSDGNLIIGTASAGANVVFAVGGQRSANVVATFSRYGLTMNGASYIKFSDNSIQSVAAAPAALSQGAYDTANSASANSIITQGVDVWQNTQITAVNQYAQSGFATANDANGMAVYAAQTANGANGLAAGAFNTANGANGLAAGAFITANGANGLAAGAFDAANGANGLASSAYNTANGANGLAAGAFVTANGANGLAAGAFNTANGANGLAAGAFNTANGANGLASGAFNKANNAVANTFSITLNNSIYIPGSLVVDGLVFANGATYVANTMSIPTTYSTPQTNITLNYQQANIIKTNITSDLVVAHTNFVLGKYIELFVYNDSGVTRTITHGVSANNASTKSLTSLVPPYSTKHLKYFTIDSDLANTYVVEALSENYNASNVTFAGLVSVNNSTFSSNSALINITASDGYAVAAPSNTNYILHITGKANSTTRVVIDSFGANTYPLVSGRMGRGSAAAPAAVANNDVLMRVVGNGYTGTQFSASSPSKIDFVASENFSDTNRGTRIEFWNTPTGSNTIQKIANFNASTAEFIGTVNPQKGFIFSPRLPVGLQTAITVDFGSDSIIKASLDQDLAVTLTNYQYGKIVEVWLTNTGAQNRTVTHGCTALNSTNKSTTYTITSGSSAHLRYFSVNGDNANTFVSIIP